MTLKYPQEAGATDSDYVTFAPMRYRSNLASSRGGAGAPPAGDAQSVILYMPNSTPAMGNPNNWGSKTFEGPIGSLIRGAAEATGQAGGALMNGEGISAVTERLADRARAGVKNTNFKGAVVQGAMELAGKQVGLSANQLLALGSGQTFNPNIELLYSSPQLRNFSLSFDMVPKSPGEAEIVNQIVLNFKKWSSPLDLENGMFEVPYVWQVTYNSGSGPNKFMNRFKRAACTNVSAQANSQTPMHVAHEQGVPITTSLQLSFQEVDIITRNDHEQVGGQGY